MAVVNQVTLSEALANNRFSAEFFDPRYVFSPAEPTTWVPIGRLLKKCEYGLSVQMNMEGKGFPMFRMNEIDNCFALRPGKYAKIPKKLFDTYKLKENDVLFNRTNSFEFVGRTGIVKDQTDCTFASYLIRLVPNTDYLLPEFLTVYLNTPFGIGQIKRRAMRSINQANVSGSEVRKILIPLIDKSVQEGIADVVNKAFTAQRASVTLYIKAQRLLESELGMDKLNLRKPVGNSAIFNAVGLSDTFSAGRIDAQCFTPSARFYENWLHAYGNCDRLSLLLEGMAKGRQQTEASKSTTDYCSIKHISGRELVGASKCSSSHNTPLAEIDDLLLAITGATIGKIGIVKRYPHLAFSGDLLRLRVKSEIEPHYLLVVLDHPLGQVQFNRRITGSTNGHLAPRDVGRVQVPRLKEDTERRISDLVKESLARQIESEKLLAQAKAHVEQVVFEAVKT